MTDLDTFLSWSRLNGLEHHKLFYGSYSCKVLDNRDPKELGRIIIGTVYFGGDENKKIGTWVEPVSPSRSWFSPPEIGDYVWVRFDLGNPALPVHYYGTTKPFTQDKISEFAYTNGQPQVRGIVSRLGHRILWSDNPGNEFVRVIWHKPDPGDPALTDANGAKYADRTKGNVSFLSFEPNGDVLLMNKTGAMIHMNADDNALTIAVKQGSGADAKANTIAMTKTGITVADGTGENFISLDSGDINLACKGTVTISAKALNVKTGSYHLGKGADKAVVKGPELMSFLADHTHPTGMGPSGKPLPQPLSKRIRSDNGKVK